MDACQDPRETVEVHRLFETVADGLRHEGMVRKLAIARNIFQTCGGVRENGRQQVVGQHSLQRRRHLSPATKPGHGKGDRRVPPPPRLEYRGVEQRLNQNIFGSGRM